MDSVELGLERRKNSNKHKRHESSHRHRVIQDETCFEESLHSYVKNHDEVDEGDLLDPPPLIEMDSASFANLYTMPTTLMTEKRNTTPGPDTSEEPTPKMAHPSRKTPTETK
jgi:hypothetical protein